MGVPEVPDGSNGFQTPRGLVPNGFRCTRAYGSMERALARMEQRLWRAWNCAKRIWNSHLWPKSADARQKTKKQS